MQQYIALVEERSGDTTPRRMTGATLHIHVHVAYISGDKPACAADPCSLSGALLAHDVNVCIERPSGALPPEKGCLGPGFATSDELVLQVGRGWLW